jgi:hypothetical protein
LRCWLVSDASRLCPPTSSPPDLLAQCFGDLRALLTSSKHRGFVVISYHDIRAARLAQHTLHGQEWRGRPLSCAATHAADAPGDGASGTLLLVSLDGGRSVQDAYYVLSAYGELRDLRDDPSRPHCCLAEFFDARHAAAALRGVPATPELASRMLVLDAGSVGGGPGAQQAAYGQQQQQQQQQGQGSLRAVGSSPAVMQLQGHSSSSRLDGLHAAAGGAGLAGDLAGMTRNLSEMSLENAASGGGMAAAAHALGGLGGMGGSSMSVGDLATLGGGGGGGMYGLRGTASAGSLWPQPTPGSLGTSPAGGGGVWPGAGPGGAAMLDPLAAAQQHHAASAAFLQQQQRQQHNMMAQNAAVQAALQQALLSQHAAALLQGAGARPQAGPGGVIGGMPRRGHSDPALGGRLARRPMDPAAEAERRAQQERLYSLDMGRIAAGEDRRTTLMVKNIPNKYTQKMLLAVRRRVCPLTDARSRPALSRAPPPRPPAPVLPPSCPPLTPLTPSAARS